MEIIERNNHAKNQLIQKHLTEVCEERIIVTQIENRSNNYAQFF